METTDQQAGTILMRISFTGLFLFVPEPGTDKVHVLLPRTPGVGHQHHHVARLLVSSAHLNDDSGKKKRLLHIPLERWALELPAASATGSADTDLSKFPSIGSLAGVVKEKVKRNRIRRLPPPAKVVARVTLAAGKMEATEKGALWEVQTENGVTVEKCMTWTVTWNIRVPGTGPFHGQLLSLLNEHVHEDLPPLHPIADEREQVIDMQFFHVPEDELPPFVGPPCTVPAVADHFHLYSNIFDSAHLPPAKLVKCDCGNGAATGGDQMRVQPPLPKRGSFFTCIVATAPLDPSA